MATDRSKLRDFAQARLTRAQESGNEQAAAANRRLLSSFDDPQDRVTKPGRESEFKGRPIATTTGTRNVQELAELAYPGSTFGPRGSAGVPSPVRDLPIPELPQGQRDQDFLTGIGGKTLNQLTPDEIQRLITLEQQRAGEAAIESVRDQFGTGLEALGGQIGRTELELAAAREAAPGQIQSEIERAFGLVDEKFAPRFSQLERQGQRQLEDTQRSFSFRGTGRGTRATGARQEVLEQTAQLERAVQAEAQLEKRLLQAQIEGESDEVLAGLSNQLNAFKTQRVELENAQATAIASLQQELAQTGAGSVQSFLETLQTQAALAQFDPTLSNALGQIVDSQGNPIAGADGSPLEFATGMPDADMAVSQALGVLADSKGAAITDVNGDPIPVNKGVKSTFQDGSKNTYILFEDGSVQQVGAAGGTGGGFGTAGSAAGFDPGQTAVYNDIASYAADNNVSFTQAVDDLGYGTSISDRRELINATDAYVQTQLAGLGTAPATGGGRTGGLAGALGGIIGSGVRQTEGFQKAEKVGGVLDFLFGEKQ